MLGGLVAPGVVVLVAGVAATPHMAPVVVELVVLVVVQFTVPFVAVGGHLGVYPLLIFPNLPPELLPRCLPGFYPKFLPGFCCERPEFFYLSACPF